MTDNHVGSVLGGSAPAFGVTFWNAPSSVLMGVCYCCYEELILMRW